MNKYTVEDFDEEAATKFTIYTPPYRKWTHQATGRWCAHPWPSPGPVIGLPPPPPFEITHVDGKITFHASAGTGRALDHDGAPWEGVPLFCFSFKLRTVDHLTIYFETENTTIVGQPIQDLGDGRLSFYSGAVEVSGEDALEPCHFGAMITVSANMVTLLFDDGGFSYSGECPRHFLEDATRGPLIVDTFGASMSNLGWKLDIAVPECIGRPLHNEILFTKRYLEAGGPCGLSSVR